MERHPESVTNRTPSTFLVEHWSSSSCPEAPGFPADYDTHHASRIEPGDWDSAAVAAGCVAVAVVQACGALAVSACDPDDRRDHDPDSRRSAENGIGDGDQGRNPDSEGDDSCPDTRTGSDFVQTDRDICYTGRVVGEGVGAHPRAAVAVAGGAVCLDKSADVPLVSVTLGSKGQGAPAAAG